MSNISASLFRAMNISQVSNSRISSNSTEILYDITLFGPQDWGCLLHTHRHWALLQVIPAPHGTDGLSLFLHWHWHRSGFHSSNSKSQSFGPRTHSHPQRVWFFTCVVRISSVPTTCTVTDTSSYSSGMHDFTEGWIWSHDPPHWWSFTK